jgi:hypothetical protein
VNPDTMEGTSSRSSIFSLQGRWFLQARRRWNDSGLSVKLTACAREWRTGQELTVGAGADAPVPEDDMECQRAERIS